MNTHTHTHACRVRKVKECDQSGHHCITSGSVKDKNNILVIDIYSGDVVRPLGHNEHVTYCPSQLIMPRALTHQ